MYGRLMPRSTLSSSRAKTSSPRAPFAKMRPLYQYEDHVLLSAGAAQPISASASVAPSIRASTSTTVVPPVYADETSTLFPSLFGTKLKLCIVHVPGMDRGGL